jgi:hypothetical protein
MDSSWVHSLAEVDIRMAHTAPAAPEMLTIQQVAQRLGITPRSVTRARSDGRLKLDPVPWNGRKTLFLRVDVDRIMDGTLRGHAPRTPPKPLPRRRRAS